MALMDLIGLGADKQAVILDIGSAFTKIGFAGEFVPRHIIRTELCKVVDGQLVKEHLFTDNTKDDEVEFVRFRDFFYGVYFKYLLVNPKERRVVICDSMLKPVSLRNLIAKVLFKHFEVVSIAFVPSSLLALFALGLKTGVVLDCGNEETTVIPFFEQTPILSAMQFVDLAGKTVDRNIEKLVLSNGIVMVGAKEVSASTCLQTLDEKVVEDIKTRCCFVGRRACDLLATPVKYPLTGDMCLNLSGGLRAHAFDVLFKDNEDGESMTTAVLDAILKSPIDCRTSLAKNIVCIGGTSMAPGFLPRLYAELKQALNGEKYREKLFAKEIAFQNPSVQENCCVWLGASLFGGLEILSDQSMSRERYNKDPNIPDWSSMLSVSKEAPSKSLLDDKYKWASLRKTLPTSKYSPSATERVRKELGITK